MGRRLYRDITVRGVTYATVQDAARALGVQDQTVRKAIVAGTLDLLGTGASHPRPLPVRIRGVTYASAKAAAQALGVTQGAIHQALACGAPDRVGLPPVPRNPMAREFVIAGMRWPSLAAASRALGFSPGYISKVLRRGCPHGRERIIAAAMALRAQAEGQGAVVVLAGRHWPTGRAAAEALGLSPQYLANCLKTPEGRARLEARARKKLGVAA